MALIIRTFKKAGMLGAILLAVICFSCTTRANNDYSSNEYRLLLSIDTLNSIRNPGRIDTLIKTVCHIGCADNKGYTGKFSLKYSLMNRSFTDFSGDQYILNLPFVGYKCPNSFLDHFYTKKEIKLDDLNNNISSDVRSHITETRSNNTYPSIFDLSVKDNTSIEDLSDLISQILFGYIQVYQEYATSKWNKEISELTSNEIKEIQQWEPIRIRIIPENGELYCNE